MFDDKLVYIAIAVREKGGGVLHFYNQFVNQVNKLFCVAIKVKHLLGKFCLTAF